jgi:hypothetical protein
MLRVHAVLGWFVVTAVVLFAACDDSAVPEPCTDIPPGGCPRSHGVACEDPACEAVYLCRPNNVWEFYERCPPRGAGPDAAPTVVSDAEAGPPLAFDASIDAPPGSFGGRGCEPLQEPECMLGLALSCGADCCGCQDLFVCEDEGWTYWGTCGGDGGVSRAP